LDLVRRAIAAIATVIVLASTIAYGQSESSASSGEAAAVKNRLADVAATCNREDLQAYAACFETRRRDTILRFAGPLFAQHALHMTIEDSHVMKVNKNHADIAVKYSISLTEHKFDILSIVHLKRSNETWLISRETIQSFVEPQRPSPTCMGGSCGRLGGGCPIRSSCSSGGCGLTGP